jgi:hypothetical protein
MVRDGSGAYHRVSLFTKGSAFPLVISRFVNPAASNGKSGTYMVTHNVSECSWRWATMRVMYSSTMTTSNAGRKKRRGLGGVHHSVCLGEHLVLIGVGLIIEADCVDATWGVTIPQLSPCDAAREARAAAGFASRR